MFNSVVGLGILEHPLIAWAQASELRHPVVSPKRKFSPFGRVWPHALQHKSKSIRAHPCPLEEHRPARADCRRHILQQLVRPQNGKH
jgi:hypothetical protein